VITTSTSTFVPHASSTLTARRDATRRDATRENSLAMGQSRRYELTPTATATARLFQSPTAALKPSFAEGEQQKARRLQSSSVKTPLRDATNAPSRMSPITKETELRVTIARMSAERQESDAAWAKRVADAERASSSAVSENEEWLTRALQAKARDASMLEVKNHALSKRVVELELLVKAGENNLRDALDKLDAYRAELKEAVSDAKIVHTRYKATKRARNDANALVKAMKDEIARLNTALEVATAPPSEEDEANASEETSTDVVVAEARVPFSSSRLSALVRIPTSVADTSLGIMTFILEQPRPLVAAALAFVHFVAVALFMTIRVNAHRKPSPTTHHHPFDVSTFDVSGFMRAFHTLF